MGHTCDLYLVIIFQEYRELFNGRRSSWCRRHDRVFLSYLSSTMIRSARLEIPYVMFAIYGRPPSDMMPRRSSFVRHVCPVHH